jgi:hypothetical protein
VRLCRVFIIGILLSLSGCFIFDNVYDGSMPGIAFQVVVSGSPSYSGTYTWSSVHGAFEATVGGNQYFIYLWPTGEWCLSNLMSKGPLSGAVAYSAATYSALPPVNGANWNAVVSVIDDGMGGISGNAAGPGAPVTNGDTLQVAFRSTSPGGSAGYQWQRSYSSNFSSIEMVGTNSTYQTSSDTGKWIRVIVTPKDSTGAVLGTPVTSAPVRVN